ncbi:hypothetical protein Pelo_151 [Pelomyxa schiedti]|nr:hypothetical protein Pelo_151 [Pelomyxa schiedti]
MLVSRPMCVALAILGYLACVVVATNDLVIHVFDVGQGDSQLIVFPSGYSILIDVGEESVNSHTNAIYVASRIRNITGSSVVDTAIVTHLHTDHIGSVNKGGMWYLMEVEGISFRQFIDRDAGTWSDADGDDYCDFSEVSWQNVGKVVDSMDYWLCYMQDPSTSVNSVRETASLCSSTQINPPDADATVTIISADGAGAFTKTGESLHANLSGLECPPSENDYSIGILLQLGDFSYFSIGDTSGVYSTSGSAPSCYTYNEEEQVVAQRVGNVDVYHVSHHGSSSASSSEFLDSILPTASIISVGLGNTYGHPSASTLTRLVSTSTVFLTEMGDPDRNYTGTYLASGDIVLKHRPGASTYTIQPGTQSPVAFSITTKTPASTVCSSPSSSDTHPSLSYSHGQVLSTITLLLCSLFVILVT